MKYNLMQGRLKNLDLRTLWENKNQYKFDQIQEIGSLAFLVVEMWLPEMYS